MNGVPDSFASRSTPIGGRRILVVDDEAESAEMMAEILRVSSHEVRTAGDGPSALDVARQFRPELAILDIGLPVMDGYELGRRLRAELGPSAPVLLALSGYGQASDRARSEAAGFDLHLVKPVDVARLLAAIEEFLRA